MFYLESLSLYIIKIYLLNQNPAINTNIHLTFTKNRTN